MNSENAKNLMYYVQGEQSQTINGERSSQENDSNTMNALGLLKLSHHKNNHTVKTTLTSITARSKSHAHKNAPFFTPLINFSVQTITHLMSQGLVCSGGREVMLSCKNLSIKKVCK